MHLSRLVNLVGSSEAQNESCKSSFNAETVTSDHTSHAPIGQGIFRLNMATYSFTIAGNAADVPAGLALEPFESVYPGLLIPSSFLRDLIICRSSLPSSSPFRFLVWIIHPALRLHEHYHSRIPSRGKQRRDSSGSSCPGFMSRSHFASR